MIVNKDTRASSLIRPSHKSEVLWGIGPCACQYPSRTASRRAAGRAALIGLPDALGMRLVCGVILSSLYYSIFFPFGFRLVRDGTVKQPGSASGVTHRTMTHG